MNVRPNRHRATIAVAAAFVASLLGYAAVTVDYGLPSAEALQRATVSTAEPYTAVADYVDTLIWWHHHPDWSLTDGCA
jgi:hypothetical protein